MDLKDPHPNTLSLSPSASGTSESSTASAMGQISNLKELSSGRSSNKSSHLTAMISVTG